MDIEDLNEMGEKLSEPLTNDYSVEGIVKAYSVWLEVKATGHLKAFKGRLAKDPLAARAEALTFNLLR